MDLYRERSVRWSLPADCVLDWSMAFPKQTVPVDVVLDIGFGGGEALIAMAAERPNEAVVGVEVQVTETTPGPPMIV